MTKSSASSLSLLAVLVLGLSLAGCCGNACIKDPPCACKKPAPPAPCAPCAAPGK